MDDRWKGDLWAWVLSVLFFGGVALAKASLALRMTGGGAEVWSAIDENALIEFYGSLAVLQMPPFLLLPAGNLLGLLFIALPAWVFLFKFFSAMARGDSVFGRTVRGFFIFAGVGIVAQLCFDIATAECGGWDYRPWIRQLGEWACQFDFHIWLMPLFGIFVLFLVAYGNRLSSQDDTLPF